jgi:hypothetical protein
VAKDGMLGWNEPQIENLTEKYNLLLEHRFKRTKKSLICEDLFSSALNFRSRV